MTPENFKYSASHPGGLLKFIYDWPIVKQETGSAYCAAIAKVLLISFCNFIIPGVQPIRGSEHQPRIDRKQAVKMPGSCGEIIVHRELGLHKEFANGIFSAQEKSEGKRLEPQLVIEVDIVGIIKYVTVVPDQRCIGIGRLVEPEFLRT